MLTRSRHPWSCAALVLAGCDGPQSALDPAGRDAARIAELFWWMAGSGFLVWLAVVATAIYAMKSARRTHSPEAMRRFVLIGGAVVPTTLLTALLAVGLGTMPSLLDPGEASELRIHVIGEQWWWRARYLLPGGREVELANELRVSVGSRVPISLESPGVIHSFWVPSLAGKVDVIPGRVTRMALEPTRTGTFRGVCAEFCGTSHAWMGFHVVVVEPAELDAWMAHQESPAAPPSSELARRGESLFTSLGCGACHAVRGTHADGRVGPDLTHVGSRVSLAAATLDNDVAGFERWLRDTERVKPEVHMPAFDMLPEADLRALATYLEGLR